MSNISIITDFWPLVATEYVLSIFKKCVFTWYNFFAFSFFFSLSELLDFKCPCYEQRMAGFLCLISESIFKFMDLVYKHLEYILYIY